jgi:transposase
MGRSGRRMIEALIAGESDPDALAALAHRRIKVSANEFAAALRGRVTEHHRFMLRLHLQQVDALDATITQIDQEVDANVEPFRTAIKILCTIPGISDLSAAVIVAEIGIDMSRFPTAGHLTPGPASVPRTTKAPASADPLACAKGLPG